MRAGRRALLDRALWEARAAAFPPGEFVGQESFVTATEVLELAGRAGVAPGVPVLDLCCGGAGPGLHVARELGCTYVGVDASRRAIARARHRATTEGVAGRFRVARVPPVPHGPFDVVILLETLLAFADKQVVVRGVSSALAPGGRFAFTVEEGAPLTERERRSMPAADTVWLTRWPDLCADLEGSGMRLLWHAECSSAHAAAAGALLRAYTVAAADLTALAGARFVADLLTAHRLWSRWLRTGRARKFVVVAEKVSP